MNKKVYYNTKFMLLTTGDIQPAGNQLIVDTVNLSKKILNEGINNFIQQNEGPNLILKCLNVDTLFEELKTQFKYIEAAGGLIEQHKKYLFIYRLNKWDLPKGKIDKGENPKQAALRECEEECAINGLDIIKELASTYHIYYHKEKYVLKTTYWFLMKSDFTGKLIPQTEENIEKVEWLDEKSIKKEVMKNTYPSVLDLINIILPD